MPIRAENRGRYPADWAAISARIRFGRAGGRCEWIEDGRRCAARHGEPAPLSGARVVLTVAHLDHAPENCEDGNLRAWCQLHHNRYDAKHRAAGIRARARAAAARGDLFEAPP